MRLQRCLAYRASDHGMRASWRGQARQPANPRRFVRPWCRRRAPDASEDAVGACCDATGGRQEDLERRATTVLLCQVRLVRETSFGTLARRYDQETGGTLVVAGVHARLAIPVIRS